jgi:hypothetical protein
MNGTIPIENIKGEALTTAQRDYLEGFFAGLAARGLKFSDVDPTPQPARTVQQADLIFEERVKRELHPLDAYPQLLQNAAANQAPDKESTFRFKWNGLFYLAPNKEGFMARLRIPGGVVKTYQLREIASVAKELTTGYAQITTRANFQIRLIQPKDAPEVLRRIQAVGLHTRGAGADNIRNLTANPTALRQIRRPALTRTSYSMLRRSARNSPTSSLTTGRFMTCPGNSTLLSTAAVSSVRWRTPTTSEQKPSRSGTRYSSDWRLAVPRVTKRSHVTSESWFHPML